VATYAVTGVKYLDEKIRELSQSAKNNRDMGKSSSGVWISFDPKFVDYLEGQTPIVTVTPTSANQGYYISEVTAEGFQVSGNIDFSFNWIAIAEETKLERLERGRDELLSEIDPRLLEQLEVPQHKTELVRNYWESEDQKYSEQFERLTQDMGEESTTEADPNDPYNPENTLSKEDFVHPAMNDHKEGQTIEVDKEVKEMQRSEQPTNEEQTPSMDEFKQKEVEKERRK
jgi:hypothetical protein